jgi:hypothetical protein
VQGLKTAGEKGTWRKGERGQKTEMHLLSQLLHFPLPSLIISPVYQVILLNKN